MSFEQPLPASTTDSGIPIASDEHSLTVGPKGPTVLHDAHTVQKMQHFNRERVPERVVHANREHRIARRASDDVVNRGMKRSRIHSSRDQIVEHHRSCGQRPELPAHCLADAHYHISLHLVHLGEGRSLD